MTYTPTFMEKLLGRNYKWWYIIKFGFISNTFYRWNSFMWMCSSVTLVTATVFVWYLNIGSDISFSKIFTYLVVGEAFIFSTSIHFDIGEDIKEGNITSKLVRPTNVLGFYFFQSFGYQLFENISKFIIYFLAAGLFWEVVILPDFFHFLVFLGAIVLAYFINTFIGMISGLLAFWLTAFFGSIGFFDNLKLVLSGKFFPLDLTKITSGLSFLVFSFTFYHPMQIYLGKYDTNQTILVFLGGVAWCVILYFLAKLVFKLGLKRNESVGL